MTAPAWAEQARVEAFQARYAPPEPRDWRFWALLPWLALSVAVEEGLRCVRDALGSLSANRKA